MFSVFKSAALLSVLLPLPVLAEAGSQTPPKEKVKLGVIASQVQIPSNTLIAVDDTAVGSAPGEAKNPLIGNIRRIDDKTCVAQVQNKGELAYSIGFSVVGTQPDGRQVLDRGYLASLSPNEAIERRVSGCDSELNIEIVLKKARELSQHGG
jgi:hypothetical protein